MCELSTALMIGGGLISGAGQIASDHRGYLNSEDLWPLTAAEKSAWHAT